MRADGLAVASLVAVEGGEVAGRILFSELPVETDGRVILAVSLAPMAVPPDWQRKDIGSTLVRAGLDLCHKRGKAVVLVLGHPGYKPALLTQDRHEARQGPVDTSRATGDAWMALELRPGALSEVAATVRYPVAFGLVES